MAGVTSNAAPPLFGRWQFCPVTVELGKVRSRYEGLKLKVSFEDLLQHVRHLDVHDQPSLTAGGAFSDIGLQPEIGGASQSARLRAGYTRKMVDQLERACALSLAARALQPKPLYSLLKDIRSYCDQFDRLAAEQSANCGLGGKARHAKNDPVKEEAARLIRARSPVVGWANPRAAATAIWPELRQFVIAGHFSMTHDYGLIRTIMRWISRIDQVRCAYEEAASP